MIALLSKIVGPFMPLIVKVILGWIDKHENKLVLKENFMGFIRELAIDKNTPARMRESYRDQLKNFKQEIAND